jgi:hypothetical protein
MNIIKICQKREWISPALINHHSSALDVGCMYEFNSIEIEIFKIK